MTPQASRPADPILVIDIGNTQTVLGVFDGDALHGFWRLSSTVRRTADELAVFVRAMCQGRLAELTRSRQVVIGSVVPMLTDEFAGMAARLFAARPFLVHSRVKTGVQLAIPDPDSLGADRIANAAAVCGGSLPVIVVDLGTATTFDVIGRGRRYRGGAIAPGIRTSADELFHRAAKLPKVEIRQPRVPIGRTTEESIQSGVFYGAVGSIDGIVRQLETQLGEPARVIATGGLAPLIAGASATIQEVDEALTLRGLLRIARLNR
jgi:type III pantothenate kinase